METPPTSTVASSLSWASCPHDPAIFQLVEGRPGVTFQELLGSMEETTSLI